jgi:predicted metal-dependent hydrolase
LCARRPRAPEPEVWRDGTTILVDGVGVPIDLRPSQRPPSPQVHVHSGAIDVLCGGALIATRVTSLGAVRPAVEHWLRARARCDLPAQLLALAALHGITVARISIRDQRSRWGACSPRGTITLNWRLIQTPPFVREYVLLHELMHRRELNHSRRFWRLVAACCPRYAEARRWLKEEGKTLWSAAD